MIISYQKIITAHYIFFSFTVDASRKYKIKKSNYGKYLIVILKSCCNDFSASLPEVGGCWVKSFLFRQTQIICKKVTVSLKVFMELTKNIQKIVDD